MKITFSQFKHIANRSRGTECFEAVVCFDGNPALIATNDGSGGADRFSPLPGQNSDQQRANLRLLESDLLTPSGGIMSDGTKGPSDLESFFAVLVDVEIRAQSLRRMLKSSILYTTTNPPCLYTSTEKPSEYWYAYLRANHSAAVILNELPFEKALDLYLDYGWPMAGQNRNPDLLGVAVAS